MSQKYKMRTTTNLLPDGYESHSTRSHTWFLPVVMLSVVGLTYLLVSTTKPPSLVREEAISFKVFEKLDNESREEEVVLAARDLLKEIPNSSPSDKFVSRVTLSIPQPLEDKTEKQAPEIESSPSPELIPTIEELAALPVVDHDYPDFSKLKTEKFEVTASAEFSRAKASSEANQQPEIAPLPEPIDPLSSDGIKSASPIKPAMEIPKARVATDQHSLLAMPLIDSPASKAQFTPWMTPSDLNRHILSKNPKPKVSFWDAGNWITAVEGRINDGEQQFRIVHERSPDDNDFRWVYRIAQTREEFARKILENRKSGYRLVQSQMYFDENEEPRFQAVWHRL